MRKLLALSLSLLLCLAMVTGIPAALAEGGEIALYLRGTNSGNAHQLLTPEEAVHTIDGTVYVPVTTIPEALGLEISVDEESGAVSISGFANSYRNTTDFNTFPISMRMQAGFNEYNAYEGGGTTLLAGEGYIDPFGVGSYHAGSGFPEAEQYPMDQYFSDWWMENLKTDLFCIYHFADGDIYAWDGILGAIRSDSDEGEADREDALVNIIVGGTGAYKGAAGILVGRTLGAGAYNDGRTPFPLPQALFKSMDGYIRLPKDPDSYVEPEVTQKLSEEATESDTEYVIIPLEMNMKAGANEHENWSSGFWTIHSGIGYLEPFGQASYHAGMGYKEAEAFPVSDYFNDNGLELFDTDLFCIYHTDYGDIYVYDGLWAYMLEEDPETKGVVGENAQRQDALVNVIIGGTGAFEGASGILVGRTLGAGEYIQCGFMPEEIVEVKDTVPYTLPETLLKQMHGYINVPADSEVAVFAK